MTIQIFPKYTKHKKNALKPIRNYINDILKQTRRIEQIFENKPNATIAAKNETLLSQKSRLSRRNK